MTPKIIAALALLASCGTTAYAAPSPRLPYCPKVTRSHATVAAFQKATGFASGRPGYVVDHVVPLCACGGDVQSNLAWQRKDSAAAKDVYEKRACDALRHLAAYAPKETAR